MDRPPKHTSHDRSIIFYTYTSVPIVLVPQKLGHSVCMLKLRTFIFGTVMYLYWGYVHGKNYGTVTNVPKIMTSEFFTFYTFGIHMHAVL